MEEEKEVLEPGVEEFTGRVYSKNIVAVKEVTEFLYGKVRVFSDIQNKVNGKVYVRINGDTKEIDRFLIEMKEIKVETGEVTEKGKKVTKTKGEIVRVKVLESLVIGELVKLDVFSTHVKVELEDGTKLDITTDETSSPIREFSNELREYGIPIQDTNRRWINRMYGFRSKKLWKMALATLFYFNLFMLILGIFVEEPTEEETTTQDNKEEVVSEDKEDKVAQDKEEKAKEDKEQKDKEEKKKEDKELLEKLKVEDEKKEKDKKAEQDKKDKAEKERKEKEELAKKKEEEDKQKELDLAEVELENKKVKEAELKAKETMVLAMLEESFKASGYVEFDRANKNYKITPTDPGFVSELMSISVGSQGTEEWYLLAESLQGLSLEVEKILGSGYYVSVVNPVNTENIILSTTDGVLFYDALPELLEQVQ